jgi:hypothetical protein
MIDKKFQVTNNSFAICIMLVLLVAMMAGSGCIDGSVKKDSVVRDRLTPGKKLGLFVLTVIVGLTFFASIAWIQHVVDQEFFWVGIYGTFVNFGFFLADVLSIILTGFITSMIFQETVRSRKDLIVISGCSTCAAGIVWLFSLYFLSVSYVFQNGHSIAGAVVPDLISLSVSHLLWIGLFAFLILLGVMGLGIIGSLVFSTTIPSLENGLQVKKKRGEIQVRSRTVVIVLIAGTITSFLVPVAFGIVGIGSCETSYSQCGVPSPVSMNVNRVDGSTIDMRISLDYSGRRSAGLIPFTSRSLQIFVDNRDFSNQSLIRKKGLPDTINPPEGITTYVDGSTVILSGPDLAGNSSFPRHIYVVSYYDQENPWVVVDTNV